MYIYQRRLKSNLENLVVGFAHPELGALLHDVGQHASAQKHHVLSPRRVFDPVEGGREEKWRK